MKLPVYLDNHATTPMDPRVFDAMSPYFTEKFGNAASRTHAYGWDAEAAVNAARTDIARLIDASPDEIIFTSGATESNNLALKGVARASGIPGAHIVTVSTEHASVLDTCRALEREGFTVSYLTVDRTGRVALDEVEIALQPNTVLVSVMTANNEIGTIAPIEAIGDLCASRSVPFHTDATQAAAYLPIDVRRMKAAYLSLSAHKMYGPKGVGALYIRKGQKRPITPLIDGGGHERGFRSGTLNVPAIVGFGKAASLVKSDMISDSSRVIRLREMFVAGLRERIPGVRINGNQIHRLPNNISVTFPGIHAETLMMDVKDIAVSSGSACSTANPEPSHVLAAIGLSEADSASTVRIGLGRFTTEEEVAYGIRRIGDAVHELAAQRHHTKKSQIAEHV